MDFSLHHTIESVIRGAALPQMQQDAGSNGPGGHVVEETESLETMILNAAASSATGTSSYALLGVNRKRISNQVGKSQSAVNQRLQNFASWIPAICGPYAFF